LAALAGRRQRDGGAVALPSQFNHGLAIVRLLPASTRGLVFHSWFSPSFAMLLDGFAIECSMEIYLACCD
jgi:hypothetical protein